MADSITCPVCQAVSHHPRDIAEGYCGQCHDWTGQKVREPPVRLDPAEAQELVRLLLKAQVPGWGTWIPMTREQYEQLSGSKMEYIDGCLVIS